MKKTLLLIMIVFSTTAFAQTDEKNDDSHGANATPGEYKALYILNSSDDAKIRGIVRYISNALDDPRLKGKLQIELIAYADGVELYRKTNHYDTLLTDLKNKGVILAECENTVKHRNINKQDLWPFISYVPSGNGEIIIRHYQGWATVQP
jgi:uncharacterized protein